MVLFWKSPGPILNEEMKKIWRILPKKTKEYVKINSPEYYQIMESNIAVSPEEQFNDFQQKIILIRNQATNIQFPQDSTDLFHVQYDITRKPIPLLSKDYDRIFPVKLVLLLLASRIIESKNIRDAYKKNRD